MNIYKGISFMKKEYINIIACMSIVWVGRIKSGKQAPLPYPPSAVYQELKKITGSLIFHGDQLDLEEKVAIRKRIIEMKSYFEHVKPQLQGYIEGKWLKDLEEDISNIYQRIVDE